MCSVSIRSRRSAQVIVSDRSHDTGTGADPYNSGFDRVMLSPGVEFTKVVDEANNRVIKLYADVEVPIYYRANAANNAGTEGQLVAPYLIKVVAKLQFLSNANRTGALMARRFAAMQRQYRGVQ